MTPHLQVRSLNAWYDRQQALKNINIEIPQKQITVIMAFRLQQNQPAQNLQPLF